MSLQVFKNNLQTYNIFETDFGTLTILEAIETAKFLRNEAQIYRSFSTTKKIDRDTYNKNDLIVVATFDPDFYRKEYLKLEKAANKLSTQIENINQNIEIEVDFDLSRYLD